VDAQREGGELVAQSVDAVIEAAEGVFAEGHGRASYHTAGGGRRG
jgi:hypothetical protein